MRRVVELGLGNFVGDDLFKFVVLIGKHSDGVVEFTTEVEHLATRLPSAESPWPSAFKSDRFFFVPDEFLWSELIVVDDVSPQVGHEEDIVVFRKN